MTVNHSAPSDVLNASLSHIGSSGDDQEVLFEQILKGQFDFPSPYWDSVSDTAKVGVKVSHKCTTHSQRRESDRYNLYCRKKSCKRPTLARASLALCMTESNCSNPTSPQALITMMLQVEAENRYAAVQVLDHPWVNVSISTQRLTRAPVLLHDSRQWSTTVRVWSVSSRRNECRGTSPSCLWRGSSRSTSTLDPEAAARRRECQSSQ